MSNLRQLWTHHKISFLVFLTGAVISLLFLVRLLVFSIYWANPDHRGLQPKPWMTPGYIAHSWQRDPDEIAAALGLEPGQRRTLAEIARDRGIPMADLLAQLNAILENGPAQ